MKGRMSLDNKPILKISMSMHSNPGVYALLLGSGISRSSGIPTGWEIVLDLIKKLAKLEGKNEIDKLEEWYYKKFNEEPDYAKILDRLTNTATERMNMLKKYFEPTELEQDENKKVPTTAHRAIAKLVKDGYIRVIITTNFDRLMELALKDVGITPDVISTEDDLKGVMPYVHSRCIIVKVNGDYSDTRIKNTPEELKKYSREMNYYLDRIFEDFGLIICGWSAIWDAALKNAIYRTNTHRFSTYYLAVGNVNEEAKTLMGRRRGEIINIDGADEFFKKLQDNIEALNELEIDYPISKDIAIAIVKKYLSEDKYRIKLHDLISEEVQKVYNKLASAKFDFNMDCNKENFQNRMKQYEIVIDRLMAILSIISYYDEGKNYYLICDVIEKLCKGVYKEGCDEYINLQVYPAFLIFYAVGISAIAGKKYKTLSGILRELTYYDLEVNETKPIIEKLSRWYVFYKAEKLVPLNNADGRFTPVSDYIFQVIKDNLTSYLIDDDKLNKDFDIFEFIYALNFVDVIGDSLYGKICAPVGMYGRKYRRVKLENMPMYTFMVDGLTDKGYLKDTDLFNGSRERFNNILEQYKNFHDEYVKKWWFLSEYLNNSRRSNEEEVDSKEE